MSVALEKFAFMTHFCIIFRKEMVKQSARVAKRISHSIRHHAQKQKQIIEDVKLMTSTCPNVKKLNLVLHYKMPVIDPECKFFSDLKKQVLRIQKLNDRE